jgi:hypothetical protein
MKYSQSYDNLKRNRKQFQAVMGVSLEIFEHLNHFFNADLEAYYERFTMSGTRRKRPMKARKDSVLCKPEDKPCFIKLPEKQCLTGDSCEQLEDKATAM